MTEAKSRPGKFTAKKRKQFAPPNKTESKNGKEGGVSFMDRARSSLPKLGSLYKIPDQQKAKTKSVPDASNTYKATLERYIAATDDRGRGTGTQRIESWIKIVVLVTRATEIAQPIADLRQQRADAVARIKHMWRTYNLRKHVHVIAFIRVRSSIGWRLMLWMRIAQKRLAAKKIVDLLVVCKKATSGAMCLTIFRQLRYKIILSQRMCRGYLLCKHARLLLLAKKWDRIEKEEKLERVENASSSFREKIEGASSALVGRGGVLDGVSSLDKRLTQMGQQQQKFETAKQERLFHTIRSTSRKSQNYGAKEAKHEVLCFLLANAREKFAMEASEAISNVIARSQKKRDDAMDAKKMGVVSKSEIESMRSMLHMGDLTDKHKIGEYMLDFKMGNKGRKPMRNELPRFLMLKYITRDQMVELVRAANRRGRNDKRGDTYFRTNSLVHLLVGSHADQKERNRNKVQSSAPVPTSGPIGRVSIHKASKYSLISGSHLVLSK
jgi:hypothetical protein